MNQNLNSRARIIKLQEDILDENPHAFVLGKNKKPKP